MSAVPKPHKITVDEYFEIEKSAERKSEFHNGEMFLMAGASWEHNLISQSLSSELYLRLKGSECQVFHSDLRVKVDRTGLYTYPDVLIVCGTPEHAPENRDTLVNPKVVFEILSDSTERYDRTTKFRHYKQLPSVLEYVLVSQDEPLVERFERQEDGTWAQSDFVGLEVEVALATVPVSVPMADIYRGVEFPAPTGPNAV
jgi:Uma2 family endonuclease